jgi:hypothetical protein
MFETHLTDKERNELIDQIAQWSVKFGLGTIIAFLVEVNRPIAPITGNLCIGFGSMISILVPIPVYKIGLLLQEDTNVKLLQKRIEELTREHNTKSTA